ncbi:MAG: infB [Candidatus Parcubacteria bacterium]|nr:infB [Candidatus Parcubacteria bacterium]
MPAKNQQNLARRSPVVVVMGHIDHGKSTLLDYIRKANIVAGEAGGITQHVGAYEAEYAAADGAKHTVTFLDTPGHEAFAGIRQRGAVAADIAILVVSAEDGVKPQTLEALREIKAAGVPYIVAINKIDKPNADIDRTKTNLAEHEVYVEGWGGDISCVPVSALKGTGVPELLETIDLTAELADLKADMSAPASGVVIESKLDTRAGITATLLIKDGTLETGTFAVAGSAFTPVRYIEDFKGAKIERATASQPVVIVGWNEMPVSGTPFVTVTGKKDAEKMAAEYAATHRTTKPNVQTAQAARMPGTKDEAPQIAIVPLIIKADVIGSLEGVKHELAKISHDRVKLKIVLEGIGEINENDVKTAIGDPTIIVLGFNEAPDKKAQAMIERSPLPLQIKTFTIIYELANYIREILTAKIPKVYIEEMLGRAKIAAVFSKEKDRQVVGGKVQEGMLETGAAVRIMRREIEIGRGTIRELQQAKKRVTEVREGFEFGTMIECKAELAEGDKIEAVHMIEKK